MKFIKRWLERRKRMKAAEPFVIQREPLKAIRAYRCAVEPISSLREAVDAVDVLRIRHGYPRAALATEKEDK